MFPSTFEKVVKHERAPCPFEKWNRALYVGGGKADALLSAFKTLFKFSLKLKGLLLLAKLDDSDERTDMTSELTYPYEKSASLFSEREF